MRLTSMNSYHSLSKYFCTQCEARKARQFALTANLSGWIL